MNELLKDKDDLMAERDGQVEMIARLREEARALRNVVALYSAPYVERCAWLIGAPYVRLK